MVGNLIHISFKLYMQQKMCMLLRDDVKIHCVKFLHNMVLFHCRYTCVNGKNDVCATLHEVWSI